MIKCNNPDCPINKYCEKYSIYNKNKIEFTILGNGNHVGCDEFKKKV